MSATTLHTKNALVLGVLLASSLALGPVFAVSVALGGSLQVVNLRLLERSVAWTLGLASQGQPGGVQALIALRFLLVMAACAAILILLPVDPIGFVCGFSSVVPTVLWHGLATAKRAA